MSINNSRKASLIQRELAQILLEYKADEPLVRAVSITHIDLAPDMSSAKVYITVFDPDKVKETISLLKDVAPFLRKMLARKAKLRSTPKLRFVYDESILRGQRLSALIDKAVAADENSHKE